MVLQVQEKTGRQANAKHSLILVSFTEEDMLWTKQR